ncbi:unnamed protein product, partial [Discosporangium mesarthrocarpum]
QEERKCRAAHYSPSTVIMRSVRVSLPLAIMLGLVGSASAFLVPHHSRPTHIMVPAHKYNAAMTRLRSPSPRVFKHMRSMSATVEADTEEAAVIPVAEEPSAAIPEEPVAILDEQPEASETTLPEVESAEAVGEEDEGDVQALEEIPLASIVPGEEYEGVVNNVVSYGAFVDLGTEVNGLVHISQLADEFVANTEDHVKEGDTVRVRVLSVDPEARKLVLSMRQNPRPARSNQGDVTVYAKMLAEDPGRFIEGTVDSIVTYGAFVTLPEDCSGFVHISQISPAGNRVEDVRDALSIGDTVSVRIREVDEALKRINLSLLPMPVDEGPAYSREDKDVGHLVDADRTELRKGIVSAVADYGVFINIDGVDGLLHISKIREDNSVTVEDLHDEFQVDMEVEVRILDVDPTRNKLSLTMLPHRPQPDFSRYVDISDEEWIEGEVVSVVDYGAFVHLGDGVDGLVHISQLSMGRVDAVTDVVNVSGDKVNVRVIEANPTSRKVRLTMKEVGTSTLPGAEKRVKATKSVEQFLDISSDEWIAGTVQTITDFGAFVAVDDETDGLLHISQISEDHIDNVGDLLEVGQEVQVRVIEVDVQNRRLGLSMKQPRPRRGGARVKKDVSVLLGCNPEEFISGTVASIVSYGAFVNVKNDLVEGGIDGLVHISELAMGRVDTVEDVVQLGQEVQVRITEVNTNSNTINLSMVPAGAYTRNRGGGFGESRGGYGGGRQRRGGGRGRGGEDDAASYGREDFAQADLRSDEGQGGGNWQQYLNNYFDDKE